MDAGALLLQAEPWIRAALQEDIPAEDVTTNAVVPAHQKARVQLLCKEEGIVAGLPVFVRAFALLNPSVQVELQVQEGQQVKPGQLVAVVQGSARALLSAERVALNFLQRMSGIATYTRRMADLLEGSGIQLLDTRKTTPNLRLFEKYAVKVGGGSNHRYNLSDGVLLKDNHIDAAGGVAQAVARAKAYAPFVRKIEVEVETVEMALEAVEAGADIIMLDNMTPQQMALAVKQIAGRVKTECSGNVTPQKVAQLRDLGVDYISCGALTHSAPILDFSLKHLELL